MALYRHLVDGETLYAAGYPAEAVFVIVEGRIKVTSDGQEDIFNAGEVVGAFDTMLGRDYTKQAVALGKTTVEVISKSEQIKHMEKSSTMRMIASLLRKLDFEAPGRWS